jgi:hypothetical protein
MSDMLFSRFTNRRDWQRNQEEVERLLQGLGTEGEVGCCSVLRQRAGYHRGGAELCWKYAMRILELCPCTPMLNHTGKSFETAKKKILHSAEFVFLASEPCRPFPKVNVELLL